MGIALLVLGSIFITAGKREMNKIEENDTRGVLFQKSTFLLMIGVSLLIGGVTYFIFK